MGHHPWLLGSQHGWLVRYNYAKPVPNIPPKGTSYEFPCLHRYFTMFPDCASTYVGKYINRRLVLCDLTVLQAQGLTVGVIIASAVLTAHSRKPVDVYHPHSQPDHSWAVAVGSSSVFPSHHFISTCFQVAETERQNLQQMEHRKQ